MDNEELLTLLIKQVAQGMLRLESKDKVDKKNIDNMISKISRKNKLDKKDFSFANGRLRDARLPCLTSVSILYKGKSVLVHGISNSALEELLS